MKWITRQRIRVNRIATCWLIRRFVDSAAEFLFVPAEEGRYGGRAKHSVKTTVTAYRNREVQTDYGRFAQRHSLLYSWTPQTTRVHITRGAGIGVRDRG